VKQIKQELIESVGTAYEPLLEKYIGHRIVFELIKGDKLEKYSGILKNYTTLFIEIMDVKYCSSKDKHHRLADIIIPQKLGIIRHLGESRVR
jgi:hypothetical protein